jgi:hypothetical protein
VNLQSRSSCEKTEVFVGVARCGRICR